MSIEKNVQIVKDFFAALGRHDQQGLLALVAENIEWIIPGEDWPLAGTHRGHAGLADVLNASTDNVGNHRCMSRGRARNSASARQYCSEMADDPVPLLPQSAVSASGELLPQSAVLPHRAVEPFGSLLLQMGVVPHSAVEFAPDRNALFP